jgi:hypothetical protein
LQKRISCLKSEEPEVKTHVPTAPTIASIIAGLQVQIAVRYLHGLELPTGKRLGLYGLSDLFFDYKLEISSDCGLHAAIEPLPDKIEWLNASPEDSLERILTLASESWNANRIVWDFDRDLITALICSTCGKKADFAGTYSAYSGSFACSCGGLYKPQIAIDYTGSEPWGNRSLRSLGFPADHLYCAASGDKRFYFRI